MSSGTERARIELLRAALDAGPDSRVLLGIGDDAAALAPIAEPLVWTIDAAVEGTHFRRGLLPLDDLGWRSTMAAASDLAAMGARPLALLAALGLPPWVTDEDLAAIARGQRAAADAIGAPLVGGNLSRASELSIVTTALGAVDQPIRRDGARPGDVIWMAGPVGLAGAGLLLLERGFERGNEPGDAGVDPSMAEAIAAWRRPMARIGDGLRAKVYASAGIDVSDGLARDLGHVARASGVRAAIDAAAIVSPALRAAAAAAGADPLALALHGGEDYALVVTAPSRAPLEGFARIGVCEARSAAEPAVVIVDADGRGVAVDDLGFDHFAPPAGAS